MRKTTLNLMLAATLILGACNGGEKKAENNAGADTTKTAAPKTSGSKLEGSWEVKREDGEENSQQVGTVYEFSGDKLTLSAQGFSNPGTTEVTDKTFSFTVEGGKDKIMYNYTLEGDTLVVSLQEGVQTFRLVKK